MSVNNLSLKVHLKHLKHWRFFLSYLNANLNEARSQFDFQFQEYFLFYFKTLHLKFLNTALKSCNIAKGATHNGAGFNDNQNSSNDNWLGNS